MFKLKPIKPVLLIACFFASSAIAKPAATVVGITGKVDWRVSQEAVWSGAQLQQVLDEGQHVKTGRRSRTALLFTDQSQMRLNQNSLLIVKSVLDDQGQSTRFRLDQGRAWVKSKNIPDKLIMETPSSVAAIRGTDWDIEVSEEGTTRLTVVHGSVQLSNEFGAVTINAGEQGIAEMGKAPVKVIIVNPQERIQWVTQYQSDIAALLAEHPITLSNPDRFNEILEAINQKRLADAEDLVKDYHPSPEKLLVEVDFLMYAGELAEAHKQLAAYAELASHLALQIKLARIKLAAGKPEAINIKNSAEAAITEGDIAIFEGDWRRAIEAYENAIAINPNNPFGYFGLGKVYSEREFIEEALINLDLAIVKQANPRFLGERATTLTFANELGSAEQDYQQAFAIDSANAILLTGRGIMLLKQGETDSAVQDFLKATTLEPQFARVNVFLAIAYYQQGNHELALETLSYASELDDKDPLPYLLRSTILKESYEPYLALKASQKAVQRLPNLKSLNQLADDRSGSNNLGAAVANFGMNEWALSIALDSYDPFWSASPLFLADRISSERLIGNSERMKGFLLDPTVFGASNRFPTLLKKPGHYISLSNVYQNLEGDEFETDIDFPKIGINGFFNSPVPIAYFAQLAQQKRDTETAFEGSNTGTVVEPERETYGVGAHLTNDLRIFYFDESATQDGSQNSVNDFPSGLFVFDTKLEEENSLRASGVTYRFDPNTSFSVLSTKTENIQRRFDDSVFSSDNEFNATTTSSVKSNLNQVIQRSQHLHFKHRNDWYYYDLGYEFVEHSQLFANNDLSETFSETKFNGEVISSFSTENRSFSTLQDKLDTTNLFVNFQVEMTQELRGIFSLSRVKVKKTGKDEGGTPDQITFNVDTDVSFMDTVFSFGFELTPLPHHRLRMVYDEFVYSLQETTLDKTFVAGTPRLNRYLGPAGRQETSALRWEYTGFENSYVEAFYSKRDFDNSLQQNIDVDKVVTTGLLDINNLSNSVEAAFVDDFQLPSVKVDDTRLGTSRNIGFTYNTFFTENLAFYFTKEWQESRDLSDPENVILIPEDYRSRSRFGLVYSSPWKFRIGYLWDQFDFELDESAVANLRQDGVYRKITYTHEFFDRHLWVYAQWQKNETLEQPTESYLIGVDIRF